MCSETSVEGVPKEKRPGEGEGKGKGKEEGSWLGERLREEERGQGEERRAGSDLKTGQREEKAKFAFAFLIEGIQERR